MIIDKELLALSDVAKLCDTSNSNVSNWRTRDKRFPTPYTETSAGPIWKAEDIVTYLQQKNEYDVISTGNLKTKRIAVIGRARGGKSFLNSRFVKDRMGFQELFCGNSSDKTACPIYVKISEAVTIESYVFHTDFNTIYQEDSEEISELRTQISRIVDHSFLSENKEKMLEIEMIIRKIKAIEERYPNRKNSRTYIDTYQKPSDFCKELLRECDLGSIEIIDTPGVSGNVEASRIAKSDIYIFLIKPDNSDESQTLKRIITQIKAEVATSKVAFLYKKEGIFFSQKKYEEARISVKNDMAAYTELFSDLKGNIISTELDILNPASHCILFPTMDAEEVVLSEELFLSDMKKKLVEAFIPENENKANSEFKELIESVGEDARALTLSVMQNIPTHALFEGEKEYTVENMTTEKHNRVMTKDNYRFRNDLDSAYTSENQLLNQYFSSFVVQDYPNEWQQKIIKFIYKKLSESIKNDRGLGVGSHPWEERPARTMLVEESIIADKILDGILGKNDWLMNEPYRTALRNSNISSETWNYVGCINDQEAITKLQIVKKCMLPVKVSSRREMVLSRYIGGLRKIAQYNILQLIGYDKKSAMSELIKLPF